VRRITASVRNYAAHAREWARIPTASRRFIFQKPTDADPGRGPGRHVDHPIPPITKNYHYEIELVACLKGGGKDIPGARRWTIVYGYAAGLDMTRRDLQRAMGDQKKPWEVGKSFDKSAVITHIHPVAMTGISTRARSGSR
jgi:2-keto-4-pentenoate hydratase/2-oxohepta-3-ene-1,7-dioic acid hydratase in catechol pathway